MNTFYKKSILYFLVAIVLGFLFLGIGITQAYKTFFYNEKNQFMLNQAKSIAEIYNYTIKNEINDADYFFSELKVLDEYSSYSFFVTNDNFKIIAKSTDLVDFKIDSTIYISEHNKLLDGDIIYSSNDVLNNDVLDYYLAYPVKINDDVSIIIFITTSINTLHSSIAKIYIITVIFILIAFIVGYVILSISMSKAFFRVRKFNDAANKILEGDYSEKLDIQGNDEIAQLAEIFNDMMSGLEEIENTKQQFLSNIAHDLRSPITSIKGFLDAILDGVVPEEKIPKYLNIIKSEADRLHKLTNSILDLNNISLNTKLNISTFDINKLIAEILESLNSRIFEKSLVLNYEFENTKQFVSADYEKIQRVLYNLLDNAIKFTNRNGKIITMTKVIDNKVEITVYNTGEGLSDEECKKVFDRLYKTDKSRGIDKYGLGLGLSIAKEFVNQHNENIAVYSVQNEYTKFVFHLPLYNKSSSV